MRIQPILLFTLIAASVLTISCDQAASKATREITGSYNRIDTGQFSILHQTVTIQRRSQTADENYLIITHSVTDFLDDRPNQVKERSANGVYDPKTAILTTDKQQTYAFDHQKGKLLLNTLEFNKQP